jgi:hypothetical protein
LTCSSFYLVVFKTTATLLA